MSIKERDVERYFKERCEAQGWGVRKVSWVGRRDAPDRVVMMPSCATRNACTVWVELKRPGEHPRPSQVREHDWMTTKGQNVDVLSTFEEVDRFVKGWGGVNG